MFTTVNTREMDYNLVSQRSWWWNRASLESLTLSATAPASAVVASPPRATAMQVWNWPAWERVDRRLYGDPTEPLRPIRLSGARNGAFAGQVVVSGSSAIRNLRADVTELKGDRGSIAKSAIRIRYPLYYLKSTPTFEPLEDAPPSEILPATKQPSADLAMQPVWLTVQVPRDSAGGDYAGTLTISANGLSPTAVPVQLHVSDWSLPDPRDFVTHMGFVQSPDTLAIRYNVPMWSEPHWKLIERSFAVLGQVATKELTIPLIRRAHFGNEHAMLWWVRRDDGSYEPDLHIIDRYIDTAIRQLGKVPVIIFYISEGEDGRTIPWITEFEPATGELRDAKGPCWGTDEARAFWKPAFDGIRAILAKRGLEKSLAVGYHADNGNGPEAAKECIDDLKLLVPEARWVRLGHFWFGNQRLDRAPNGNPYARVALVGNYSVFWDPDTDKPFYGWRNPWIVTAYPRDVFYLTSALWNYRIGPEAILLTGQREPPAGWGITDYAGQIGRDSFLGMRGFAPWGGDYWPVLGGRGRWRDIIARYNDPSAAHWDPRGSWSTVQLNSFQVTWIVGEGSDGPVSSVRAEILREGLQEAEARVFVQNALLDEQLTKKLSAELAARCKQLCDQRTWELRYLSEFSVAGFGKSAGPSHYVFDLAAWQQRSRQLYDLAGEVAKALGTTRAAREDRP